MSNVGYRVSSMNSRTDWVLSLLGAAAVFVLATGCETGSPASSASSGAAPASGTNLISADRVYVGDQIRVVMDAPTPINSTETTVPESGVITIHQGEKIRVAGRNTDEIAQEIINLFTVTKQVYRPGRFTVTVQVFGRSVSVGGEVRNTGSFPFEGGMTVLKAINRAGGFNEWANRSEVQVTRVNGQQFTVDCKAAVKRPEKDVPLVPGDRIQVPRKII